MLEAIGISESEERVYERLLERGTGTAEEIARDLEEPVRRMRALLKAIELKGLATHSPERVPRYLPTPPDIAVEALVLRRQEEIQRARLAALHLHERAAQARKARGTDARVVEIVIGREAQGRVFEQMQRAAASEVLSIERAPYVLQLSDMNEAQKHAIERGVRYRNVIETDALEIPGNLHRIRRHMAEGEETRMCADLPLKLVIVDRRIAIIPLHLDRAGGPALLVRSSSLLDSLCHLFELIWERATPIAFAGEADVCAADAASRALIDTELLVPLLASGLNDKAIAHELGVSARTLDRRIVEFMKSVNARTRFQAGWAAALRSTASGDDQRALSTDDTSSAPSDQRRSTS
ncbi:MAG: helix-turn-helix domain-containing protein [Rhodanobacteraceae bacterium]